MTQPTGGIWIGEYYYVALRVDPETMLGAAILAGYRNGKLVEIDVGGKLFVSAPTGTLRCSDCKHTMSGEAWAKHCFDESRSRDEYVGIDEDGICPECGKSTMEEVG